MFKKMKKFWCLLLTVCFILGLCTISYAGESSGETVTNDTFELELHRDSNGDFVCDEIITNDSNGKQRIEIPEGLVLMSYSIKNIGNNKYELYTTTRIGSLRNDYLTSVRGNFKVTNGSALNPEQYFGASWTTGTVAATKKLTAQVGRSFSIPADVTTIRLTGKSLYAMTSEHGLVSMANIDHSGNKPK